MHGGASPNGEIHAARQIGADLALNLGGPVDIDPLEALLHALRASAGAVAWYRAQVEDVAEGDLTAEVGGSEHGNGRVEPHVWIRLYAEERDRLARTAKLCLDAGVEERRVQMVEQMGEALATFAAALFEGLRLTPEQLAAAPDIVRRALLQLELTSGATVDSTVIAA